MRRCLRIAVASLALVGFDRSAHAELPVLDVSNLAQMVKQVEQGAQLLTQAEQQLNQLQATYQAFTHVTDLGTAVGALGMLGIQDPLPINPYALESLMRGQGGINGMAGSLGGLFNSNLAANKIFVPQDGSNEALSLNERLNAASAAQGIADTVFQNAQARMPLIRLLSNRIATAQDPSTKMDITARLTAEQNIGTLETNQAIATGMMSEAAMRAANLRAEQRMLQGDSEWLDQARAQTGDW